MIDLGEVRNALSAERVCSHYQIKTKREGSELVSRQCPQASHSREAFKVNIDSGRWQCFVCSTSGDLLRLVAMHEGLEIDDDFQAVLVSAAKVAGVEESISGDGGRVRIVQRNASLAQQDRVETAIKVERALDARSISAAHWDRLAKRSEVGEAYMVARGVEEIMDLPELVDLVRFDRDSPAIKLWDLNGEMRNVVSRRLPKYGDPKTPGLANCPTLGTFISSIKSIVASKIVVLVEGVIDALTATLIWWGQTILGAHSAGNLAKIAEVVAPTIAALGTRLLIVPHDDRAGYQAAMAASVHCMHAGLRASRGELQIVKHGYKDLNDAWRAGWRPQ